MSFISKRMIAMGFEPRFELIDDEESKQNTTDEPEDEEYQPRMGEEKFAPKRTRNGSNKMIRKISPILIVILEAIFQNI